MAFFANLPQAVNGLGMLSIVKVGPETVMDAVNDRCYGGGLAVCSEVVWHIVNFVGDGPLLGITGSFMGGGYHTISRLWPNSVPVGAEFEQFFIDLWVI